MQDLIDAINQINNRDIIDIIAIFSPIVLSVVAIAISLYTVQKQNKISLFEMRYKALSAIRSIATFGLTANNIDEDEAILLLFDSLFGTHIFRDETNTAFSCVNAKIESIKYDALASKLLFEKRYYQNIQDLVFDFHQFMMKLVNQQLDKETKNKFYKQCHDFLENDLEQISKRFKI